MAYTVTATIELFYAQIFELGCRYFSGVVCTSAIKVCVGGTLRKAYFFRVVG